MDGFRVVIVVDGFIIVIEDRLGFRIVAWRG